jgi:hypothetical protein
MNRELAAIIARNVPGFARSWDVAKRGHSRLMAGRKEWFAPETALHHGRPFKVTDDGKRASRRE